MDETAALIGDDDSRVHIVRADLADISALQRPGAEGAIDVGLRAGGACGEQGGDGEVVIARFGLIGVPSMLARSQLDHARAA